MLVALVMSGASLSCRCDDILIHSDKTMGRADDDNNGDDDEQ